MRRCALDLLSYEMRGYHREGSDVDCARLLFGDSLRHVAAPNLSVSELIAALDELTEKHGPLTGIELSNAVDAIGRGACRHETKPDETPVHEEIVDAIARAAGRKQVRDVDGARYWTDRAVSIAEDNRLLK
jgi:hypothetical protein